MARYRPRPTGPHVLYAVLLAAACAPAPPVPGGGRLDPTVVESWAEPQTSPVFWTVWADARDFLGEERWAALDTSWMEERARADLADLGPRNDYADEFLLSGLWRLGLLREEVLGALERREPEASWPLGPGDIRSVSAWRPRLERFRRAQVAGTARAVLVGKLAVAWAAAVAGEDLLLAARVAEAREVWLHDGPAPEELRDEAGKLIRRGLDGYERAVGKDWRNGRLPAGLLDLMERFGVPPGRDLGSAVRAARRYWREMRDETIPLPHPYDLHLAALRLERLEGGGD